MKLWGGLAVVPAIAAAGTFQVRDPPASVCASAGKGHVGYYDFDNDTKHLFFWLAESRSDPANDPVVLWMSGGPGASSVAFGLFQELGPCLINGANATIPNPYAWNNNANIIFVETPVTNLEDAISDMFNFLTAFMGNFPQYSHQDFYIIGESYGGTGVPALARKIHHRQSSPMAQLVRSTTNVKETKINLKGIGLGNAQLSQKLQWPGFYPTGCLGPNPVYNDSVCAIIEAHMPQCESMLQVCTDMDNDADVCNNVLDYCRKRSVYFIFDEHLNPYDFRKPCPDGGLCYEEADWIAGYLNSSSMRLELGVPEDVAFNIIEYELGQYFDQSGDVSFDTVSWAGELLDQGYKVLVYAGNKDWFCNSAGEKNLVHNIRWRHQPAFQAQDFQTYTLDGERIGLFKEEKALSFAEIFDAGHMVPADKPKESLFLITSWMKGELTST
ncbi:carboxypeptidase y [Colletotrichum camelliae]|nr:carboxypeptidase y [Colletotrichum camelliae]